MLVHAGIPFFLSFDESFGAQGLSECNPCYSFQIIYLLKRAFNR